MIRDRRPSGGRAQKRADNESKWCERSATKSRRNGAEADKKRKTESKRTEHQREMNGLKRDLSVCQEVHGCWFEAFGKFRVKGRFSDQVSCKSFQNVAPLRIRIEVCTRDETDPVTAC